MDDQIQKDRNQGSAVASNEQEFRDKVVDYSGGDPGAIITMVNMASLQKYRIAEHIKLSPLYLDFRLAENT